MAKSRHPLSSLSEEEISLSAKLVRVCYDAGTKLHFKGITLHEPSRKEMQQYRVHRDAGAYAPPRKSWTNYYLTGTASFFEVIVNLTTETIEKSVEVPAHFHGPIDDEEIIAVEKVALEDPRTKVEIEKLKLPGGAVVVCDPWIWGADGVADDVRQYQCYLYLRDPSNPTEVDSNHYAFPLNFSPVVDAVTMKMTRIDYLPTGSGFDTKSTEPWRNTRPNEYIPELNETRSDLKPLSVVQPEGASFTVEGDIIKWQKWEIRISFNYREGMVLHEVSYDGRLLFYRVSLSDMSVPYADPRSPFHKKQAFDLGDAGAGLMANDLKLGCDCLGAIAYKDGLIADDQGRPVAKPNAICIHEQDAGILWKHTNYRTGRPVVVRRRELVIQSIITVANYEYILAFIFDQAGEMAYEVRATGILSTQPIDPDVEVPYGTVVHDGVLAGYHQHILSLRVDPELDGDRENRLVYEETSPLPRNPEINPHGNGYISRRTTLEKSGGYDLESKNNRVFMIENPNKKNPVNGKNVAYKMHIPPVQPLLAEETSFHYKRADFADHSIYVTKYQDDELFAGGQYTNQNKQSTGVRKWAARNDSISNDDIVIWVQFGLQHVPRIEDFPVMPVEIVKVSFKPVNFFTRNPAIDVPQSTQEFNKSVLVNGHTNGANGTKGESGCSSCQ
ncbi:copper amine oxidase [Xylariales sp. AK1849]|nr:copper amine oxidase [Xylariales sp. AK1849]